MPRLHYSSLGGRGFQQRLVKTRTPLKYKWDRMRPPFSKAESQFKRTIDTTTNFTPMPVGPEAVSRIRGVVNAPSFSQISGLETSLTSLWEMNESSGNVVDQKGVNNLATSGATYGQTGVIGNAIQLSGSSSYIGNIDTTYEYSGAFSISVWVKLTAVGNAGFLVSNWAWQSNSGWLLMIESDGSITFEVHDPAQTPVNVAANAWTAITNTNWHHIVATFSPTSGKATLYLDGSFADDNSTAWQHTAAYDTNNRFSIGSDQAATAYLAATIDQVAVWSRELTSSEASELYASGAGKAYPWTITQYQVRGSIRNKPAGQILGVANGVATVSGLLKGKGALAGASNGVASQTNNLRLRKQISGASNGVASVTAVLKGKGRLAGASNGVGSNAALIKAKGQLIASLTAAATTAAIIKAKGQLITTITGVATNSGVLKGKGKLIGSSPGVASVSGNLYNATMPSGGVAGTTSGAATVSGVLTAKGQLIGASNGAASDAAILRGRAAISASSSGVASDTGVLKAKGKLLGSTNGVGSNAGIIKAKGKLIAATNGVATDAGILKGKGRLVASSTGVASVSGNLVVKAVISHISGSSSGVATISAVGRRRAKLSGTINGVATVSGYCAASALTHLDINGETVTSAVTGYWDGRVIPYTVPTALRYTNNSITSVNTAGYQLQAGNDAVSQSGDHNLDNMVVTGNKVIYNGAHAYDASEQAITHGIFTGYMSNAVIRYNNILRSPMSIIRKANGYLDTAGGVAYNVIRDPYATGIVCKGMGGVRIYNNTFYSAQPGYTSPSSGTWRGLIEIYTNDDDGGDAHGVKIKNNIFYTKYQIYNVAIYTAADLVGFECDYNIYYCEGGTPYFNYLGAAKTFAQWQALGFDTHSIVVNPNFNNFTDLVPTGRLNYGTNLGTEFQDGLATNAVWTAGYTPATARQNGAWQVGAIIYGVSAISGSTNGKATVSGDGRNSGAPPRTMGSSSGVSSLSAVIKARGRLATSSSGVASVSGNCVSGGILPGYYVATNGNDSNPGTYAQPWATWQKGFSTITAGQQLWIRGGVYTPGATMGSGDSGTTYCGVYISSKNGSSGAKYNVSAYPGEVPILDGGGITGSTYAKSGILLNNCSYWNVKGLTVRYFTQSSSPVHGAHGIELMSGNNNIIEFCDSHHNGGPGYMLRVPSGHDTHFINCDAHDNYDPYSTDPVGGDADGFDIGFGANDYRIKLTGCRSWNNSDDGFDMYQYPGYESVYILTNCWAWHNGYRSDQTTAAGDGCGFKFGADDLASYTVTRRYAYNCIAYDNRTRGFSQESARVKKELYNCISYANEDWGFSFYGYDIPDIVRNCIAFGDGVESIGTTRVHDHNSWDSGVTITAADFLGVTSQLANSRQTNGNLPIMSFLHLAASSDARGAGVQISGLTLDGDGKAYSVPPSMGAFEYYPNTVGSSSGVATVSGTLRAYARRVGSSNGVATVTGNCVAASGAHSPIAAITSGLATVFGVLQAKGKLQGSSTGVASTTGTCVNRPGGVYKIFGQIFGTSNVAGFLGSRGKSRVAINGSASVTATLRGKGKAQGSSNGVASVSATLRHPGLIKASTAGVATVTGNLAGKRRISGFTTGSSAVVGTFKSLVKQWNGTEWVYVSADVKILDQRQWVDPPTN